MKNLLLLALTAIVLCSCTEIETNDPSFQGAIDNVHFRATDSRAFQNEDTSFSIQGVLVDKRMTLKLSSLAVGTYVLGGTSGNYATLENNLGIIYHTNPEGVGEVTITNSGASSNLVSGTFDFTAMVPGVDTLKVHDGIFYQVRYSGIDSGDGENPNDGFLTANVDGAPLNPDTISAADSSDSVVILASNGASSIFIKVPIDVTSGFYELPENGFEAKYTLDNVGENAISGSIIVVTHDTAAKTLAGTFMFETENHIIEQGQFNITYQ